ncbi:MAG: ABC transporter ATP-binding protein [Eubacteriales bacterium]|nr:ABC transporter ATP-binding protein [Eubacteriales bacterium]
MLEIEALNVRYDAIHVLKNVSLSVREGEIVTLIGANGAGKTTALRTVSGLKKAASGSIRFEGEEISALPPRQRVKRGLLQVPEGRRVFPDMTVQENLDMGAYLQKDRAAAARGQKRVFESFPVLYKRRRQLAGTLSGGEQQMLAMGRALMGRPRLLLLDEPSMGLSPILVQEIFSIIREINAAGTSILLVEQNAQMALSIADRAYVLENGAIAMTGAGSELLKSGEVQKAYLGG